MAGAIQPEPTEATMGENITGEENSYLDSINGDNFDNPFNNSYVINDETFAGLTIDSASSTPHNAVEYHNPPIILDWGAERATDPNDELAEFRPMIACVMSHFNQRLRIRPDLVGLPTKNVHLEDGDAADDVQFEKAVTKRRRKFVSSAKSKAKRKQLMNTDGRSNLYFTPSVTPQFSLPASQAHSEAVSMLSTIVLQPDAPPTNSKVPTGVRSAESKRPRLTKKADQSKKPAAPLTKRVKRINSPRQSEARRKRVRTPSEPAPKVQVAEPRKLRATLKRSLQAESDAKKAESAALEALAKRRPGRPPKATKANRAIDHSSPQTRSNTRSKVAASLGTRGKRSPVSVRACRLKKTS